MSLSRLLLRNLLFHWRGNFAVFLGVVVGAAVLTGALLVGDSLRGSLHDLTLQRLGWVDETLIAPRFFRQKLAEELSGMQAADRMAPAILLQATLRRPGDVRGVRGVTVLGVDESFWQGFHEARRPEKGVWLTRTVADALHVKEGDSIGLVLQKPSEIPRESLLGRREDKNLVQTWTLPVEHILTDADAVDHFSLRPGLDAPRTAFVPLALVQTELKLDGRINALLVGGARPTLADNLHEQLDLDDWGLTLLTPEDRVQELFKKINPRGDDDQLRPARWDGLLASSVVEAMAPKKKGTPTRSEVEAYYRTQRAYLTLESRQLFIEPAVVEAAEKAAKDNDLFFSRSLVYLANAIDEAPHNAIGAATGYATPRIPYSIVAAVDDFLPLCLRYFNPSMSSFVALPKNTIILADWPESPLHVKRGDKVIVRYFPPEHSGEPQEESATFTVVGFVPLKGVTGDPDITPEFPGITDKRGFGEWKGLPFPFDSWRVGKRDEDYWKQYRTMPKAYVSLETGQKIWGTRFGKVTSIRLTPKNGSHLSAAAEDFHQSLRKYLLPDKGGFVFDKVKAEALAASEKGTDFSELFLYFSCFLIVAALLLVGLLYRLNLDRRASEIGLLLATGYRRWQVLRLLLLEGLVLSGLGSFAGCVVAVVYSGLLVRFLGWVWPGGTLQSFLQPHYSILSLAIGFFASLVISVATIFWSMRVFGKIPPSALLAGRTTAENEPGLPTRPRWSKWIVVGALILAIGCLAASPWTKAGEERAGTFFSSGGLFLIAALAGLAWWLGSSQHGTIGGHGWLSIGRLGIRNAARHRLRSLLTAGLLAAAAFLLVAVEAFRRQGDDSSNGIHSASGGFVLLAESDQPVVRDLNTDEARQELKNKLELIYRDQLHGDTEKATQRAQDAMTRLEPVKFYSFRVHAGDDASCLNLYQPRKPRILGVPESLIERGGFEFASAPPGNPWEALRQSDKPYPAFGEKNTVEWMLHSGAGKTYDVPDEDGKPQPLRIAGLLQDSVFQSGLLVSEKTFLDELYPHQEGYNFFLIDVPPQDAAEVREILETALADRGFEVTYTKDRLASYLAVENTYLSTFQALGGLGLLLGSLGLAVVLLRGVWERRAELALLRALGYRRLTLGWLVLAENAFLLVLGLAAGTLSALASVAPQLLANEASVPWRNLLLLLALVLIVGLAAGAAAVARTLRAPLIPALRRE